MNELAPSEEAFDRFLKWLHPNSEQAAQTYEAVHRRLVIFFHCRGCFNAEELADRTIDRVRQQLHKLTDSYEGDPAKYFHGVAHFIYLENYREQSRKDDEPVTDAWADPYRPEEAAEKELIVNCLEHCLQKLPTTKREAIVLYYQVNSQTQADDHLKLAELLGCSINALRLRMLRLRNELRDCITDCQQCGTVH